MSKNTKLCPFRKITEQRTNTIAGQTTLRERLQPCIGRRCMAYVYTAPIITLGDNNPANWGCARLLNQGMRDEV